MDELLLKFERAGLLTMLQDLGRPGLQKFGIPFGGALDTHAYQLANSLLGNPEGTPCLEITLFGPSILFQNQLTVQAVITGADFITSLNGRQVPKNIPFSIQGGDKLEIGKVEKGCRAYLAFSAKWKAQKWMNSVSPVNGLMNLTPDSIIQKGTELTLEPRKNLHEFSYQENNIQKDHIGVYKGPEYDLFPDEALEEFITREFTISPDSNRMGYRLIEALSKGYSSGNMISSGIIPGTVQVPASSSPIVLLADAQTTGGYPRIAVVKSEDLSLLAQYKPGDKIRFKWL